MVVSTDTTEPLGRFGHHPDPAIDFCVEVEELEAMAYDHVNGLRDCGSELVHRIAKARDFRVGGDYQAVNAMSALRSLEQMVSR